MTADHARVWREAEAAVIAGHAATLERLLRDHSDLFRQFDPPSYTPQGPFPDYAGEARSIIANEHRFNTWAEYEEHLEAVKRAGSPVARFESAVDAIVNGDVRRLQELLRANPDLVHARSTRKHHATLLHYLGANGIEGFRQKTPANAVEIARTLLDAGADVDAIAHMYGADTTLGLVATSVHPERAGVQGALMETLLNAGASIGGPQTVNGCLANGRGTAAAFLAAHGAPLDLEGAAGVGRLDIVKTFVGDDGTLAPDATPTQMSDGFAWACEYGHAEVVGFLLQRGMDANAGLRHDGRTTGLHWAAYGAHLAVVSLLLDHHARVNVRDGTHDATPLGWALYAWAGHEQAARARYYDVVARLVRAGAVVDPEWLADPDRGMPLSEEIRADARMTAALRREPDASPGAGD